MPCSPQIFRSADEIATLQPLWDRLHAADRYATIFQSFNWNHALARHFADREPPYVIATEDTIIPAAVMSDAITFMGENLADYRSCVTSNPQSESFLSAWRELARLSLPLKFTALHPAHHAIFDRFSTNDFTGAPELSGTTAIEFASRHNRMFSRLRKLERLGFRFTQRDPSDRTLLGWLYQRKAEADSGGLFHDPARVSCLIEIFTALHASTEVDTLERDGQVIAAAIAFRDRQYLRFYTNWFDSEWSHYSPGMVLLYEMTRRALEAGMSCDYLTGEQPYKLRMANRVSYLRRLDAAVDQLQSL